MSRTYNTIDVNGRTFAAPDHELGYTKTYLYGYMRSSGCYLVELFQQWIAGQTVGVTEDGESIFYTQDVFRYLNRAQ